MLHPPETAAEESAEPVPTDGATAPYGGTAWLAFGLTPREATSLTERHQGGNVPNPPKRSADVQRQAQEYAEQARQRADERRQKAPGGLSGWVAERAGQWDLQGQDEQTMQLQKFFWNPLM